MTRFINGVFSARFYYDAAGMWNIDFGPGTTSIKTASVIVEAPSRTMTNLDADNKQQPRAWLNFENVGLEVDDNFVRITPWQPCFVGA